MIIGIAGKQGHGKDTVGSIIQYVTSDYGNINSKSYRDYELFLDMGGNSHWEIKKFAGKLKQIASLLTNIPIEKFEDQEFKKFDMKSGWGMTYREFLQKLGTEAMRDGLHENVWVNALMCDYTKPCIASLNDAAIEKVIKDDKLNYPNWVITDVRFPNEIKAIKEKGGIIIKVVNPRLPVPDQEHISETLLNEVEADYTIVNKGTIKELEEEVRKFYKQII